MPFVSEVGEVVQRNGELTYEWNIRDFFSLSDKEGDFYRSPDFRFADTLWCLVLYPNGQSGKKSSGWVSHFLQRKDQDKRITIKYKFGFKSSDGLEEKNEELNHEFSNEEFDWGYSQCWKRSELRKKISSLPDNVFTITCRLRYEDFAKVSRSDRVFQISRNMGKILKDGKRSDFTLKLGDRDWPVHKVILESRCEYFANMFRHDWVENEVGEVKFDDMEEDTLDSVLRFVYTGDVEDVDVKNVCPIYVAAHKFLLDDLKALCVEYMKEKMCEDIFCKVMVIADTYVEKDLKEGAIVYFAREGSNIMDTEEWKELKKNHSSIVADLLEETFRREVKKRTK